MNDASKSGPSAFQDLIGGFLAVALGVFTLVISANYPMGSVLRMGPGFFPSIIASLIILLGLVLIRISFNSRSKQSNVPIRFRSVLMIGTGILLFALLLERAGLIPATFALVLVSSLAEPRWHVGRAALLVVALTVLAYIIFIVVLQIPVAAVNL